jgi:hypothetical protein
MPGPRWFWGERGGSDTLLELGDRALAVDIAIAADFLAADFTVVAHATLLDIGGAGRAVVDAQQAAGSPRRSGRPPNGR